MEVEIWSDVVCPWCYIGKRHLESALASFASPDPVRVVWRSYELDPNGPARRTESMAEVLQQKYGMSAGEAEAANARLTGLAAEVGLDYRLDEVAMGNTFDAHRLVHLAGTAGLADAMKERLMAAYFTEGIPIGDRSHLADLAVEVGLERTAVVELLAGSRFADEVRADERRAAELGVTGVPFFVIAGRYAVSGAQPPELLLDVLERAAADVAAGSPAPSSSEG